MVIAEGIGEVVIYAKVGKNTFEKKITVVNPIVQIIIHGKNYLYFNEEYKFTCTLSEVLEEKVTWSSSNSNILEIDNDGNAFAKKEGSVDITASIYGNTSTFTVVVVPPTIDITIIGKNLLDYGEEYTYICNLSKEVDEKIKNLKYKRDLGKEDLVYDLSMCNKWFKKSADEDYGNAQCFVGLCYYFGKGVKQDYKKALEYFEKAAASWLVASSSSVVYLGDFDAAMQNEARAV